MARSPHPHFSAVVPYNRLHALPAERISFLVTVPAVYSCVLRHKDFADANVSRVRWVGYGGAPIAPSLVCALNSAFPHAAVLSGYGMTETTSLMTVLADGGLLEPA